MRRTTTRATACIFFVMVCGLGVFAQVAPDDSEGHVTFSLGGQTLGLGETGSSHKVVNFQGLLSRSDGDTLSVELPDQRVMRFKLSPQTHYQPEDSSGRLAAFRVADVVEVKAESAARGYFLARSVRFLRRPSPEELAEILQSPEVSYREEANVIQNASIDPLRETRRLNLVAKPDAISLDVGVASPASTSASSPGVHDNLIASVRAKVNEAFEVLPNFRAKLVTSMFHSNTKKMKWVPNGVLAAEVAYEGEHETYSEIQLNGKRPADAPATGDSEYMRSFNNAWSSGDFETLSHCVFSGLADTDFHKADASQDAASELAVYEFSGGRASTCVAVRSESQIVYPGYKGSLSVRTQTKDVVHVELEAIDIPQGFPLDRAERSVDFGVVRIGEEQYLLPTTAYWFGCYRNSYYCFLNRVDFQNYRHFESDSKMRFASGN